MINLRNHEFTRSFFEKRFVSLLIALVLLLVAAPVAQTLRTGARSATASIILLGVFNVMLVSALFAVGRSRRRTMIATIPMVATFVFEVINRLTGSTTFQAINHICAICFLTYVIISIIVVLFQTRRITADTICASICAYLLIGICWALMYSLLSMTVPDAFGMGDKLAEATEMGVSTSRMSVTIYYSFVTLSTLGYGDITPIHPAARALSMGEAILGQVYLAVLVARLVGLQISQAIAKDRRH